MHNFDNNLWLGGNGVVLVFDREENYWRTLGEDRGIPKSDITSMVGDSNYIWIGSYYGIRQIDRSTKREEKMGFEYLFYNHPVNDLEINKYGIDELRYYLMKEVSHGSDGSISLKSLENCINSDLANNYGNLCQRVFSFISKNCGNEVKRTKKLSETDNNLIKETKKITQSLRKIMNDQNLNEYLKSVIDISFLTNKYINDEEPWKLKKKDIEKMNNVLHIALEQIAKISILLNPIIPISSTKVLDGLNLDSEKRNLSFLDDKNLFKEKIKIKSLNILFKKNISDDS